MSAFSGSPLSEDALYRAFMARDSRFDGKFFIGVKTTGIYCRPICPARPKRENVEFYPSAAAAESAGYRPCLRCRPEVTPQSASWQGSFAVVQRAMRVLGEPATHADPAWNEDAFAAQFGLGARHLRRLFTLAVGRTPREMRDEHRLDLARRLLRETALPMTDLAAASGFGSERSLRAAMAKRFRLSPARLRRASAPAEGKGSTGMELSLPYRAPFDFEATLGYFRRHELAGLENCGSGAYERVFRWGGKTGWLRLSPPKESSWAHPTARPALTLSVAGIPPETLGPLADNLRRMFDLDSDPSLVADALSRDRVLGPLAVRHPGLRCPCGFDPFEASVVAILGQCVSVAQGARLVNQLIREYGEPARHPLTGARLNFFPSPRAIADSDLSKVPTTGKRRAALREFARRIADGTLSLAAEQDALEFRRAIMTIPGIGAWTAETVCLRALGDPDAFPASDSVLRKFLREQPGFLSTTLSPWRGYAASHIWHGWSESQERPAA